MAKDIATRMLESQGTLRVVAAAIRLDGLTHTMPPPARHHTIIHKMADLAQNEEWYLKGEEQGFLLSDGDFANRQESAAVALAANQIPYLRWPPNLFSEDLW